MCVVYQHDAERDLHASVSGTEHRQPVHQLVDVDDQDCLALQKGTGSRIGRDGDAKVPSFLHHLADQVVVGRHIHSWAHALVQAAFEHQQADHCLATPGVHLHDKVSLSAARKPAIPDLRLHVARVLVAGVLVRQEVEDLARTGLRVEERC
jgi:hypothetical protein